MPLASAMMGRPRVGDQQPGFAGGLNAVGDALELQSNQMPRADNCRLTTIGSVTKRGGTQRMHTSALGSGNPIRAGFCWRKAASVEHIAISNGTFYSGGSSIGLPMTWTAKAMSGGAAALSSTAHISFAAFRDGSNEVLYLADGAGPLIKWDGTTLSRVASTPSVARIEVYNQRLFGVTGADQTVWYSAVNNGDTLGISGSAGGSAVVRTFGNQKITGLKTIVQTLALSHVTGVSRFTGITQDDIAIAAGAQGFSSDVGSQMPDSWVVADGVGYFLSDRGAYRAIDAGIQPLDTPTTPDPTVPVIAALGSASFAQVSGVHDPANHEIRWYIPDTGLYTFNYRLGAWTISTGIYTATPTYSQWSAVDDNGDPIVLFGSSDGFVRRADTSAASYTDDVLSDGTGGTSYTMTVTCHRMFTEDAESIKSFRFAYVFADLKASTQLALTWNSPVAGTATATLANTNPGAIWGASGLNWNAFQWGGTGATRYKVPINGRGPSIDVTISDSSTAAPIISRVSVEAFDLGRRA